ncbi:hypothetical protein [Stutzerimonas stutzeri]|uniref:hypothetical protein n=1 Tax=Stutzerimonas stutzeri TaxID=316 RepID=UPI003B9E7146
MSPRLLTFMVAFAAFLGPFTQTVYAPILPELGGALRTTPFLINLSISIFTLVLAFMQIIYGRWWIAVGASAPCWPAWQSISSLPWAVSWPIASRHCWRSARCRRSASPPERWWRSR